MLRQRISSQDPRTLATLMLVLSAALAVAVLSARNLYDDELLSLPIITSAPHGIIHFASTADVHPPGMYLLAHFAVRVLPSFRWMNLVPTAVLYVGLAIFVLSFASLFQKALSRALFLLMATLHPQLMLWGTSYRWYSWWTGLALITLVIALQPRCSEPRLTLARSVSIGVLLAGLFYINYITFLFAVTLAATMAVHYREIRTRRRLQLSLTAITVFAVLAGPQLRLLGGQLAHSRSQQSGILSSCARLLQGTLASECYLPWHRLAVITAVTVLLGLGAGLWTSTRRHASSKAERSDRPLRSIALFTCLFFLLVALCGLGGRPRNGLLLVPLFAAAFAYITRALPTRFQQTTVVLILIWSGVGIGHMLTRTGLAKSMMLDRPEQVALFVRSTASDGCAIVVTYDAPLAFAISHSGNPDTLLLSPFTRPIAESEPSLPSQCSRPTLYIAHTYVVGSAEWAANLEAELDSATRLIDGATRSASFNFDPDAARKRNLSSLPGFGADLRSAGRLPDYRYTVVSGPIAPSALPELRSRLAHFCLPNECGNPVNDTSTASD